MGTDSGEMPSSSKFRIVDNLKDFWNSSKSSDFTIVTQDQKFFVHRTVICMQSDFFNQMCKNDWAETQKKTIELKEDNPRAVEAMLKFFYGLDIFAPNDIPPMIFWVSVYQIADKFLASQLKSDVTERFVPLVHYNWEDECFPDVIAEAYDSTPPDDRGLRDTIMKVAYENLPALRKSKEFQRVLREVPGFAADLILAMDIYDSELVPTRCMTAACQAEWFCPRGNLYPKCPKCAKRSVQHGYLG